MDKPLLVNFSGRTATLTLNLPDKRNAMSAAMTSAFPEALAEVSARPEVNALIITGAGRAFCAGGDLDFLHAGPADVVEIRERMTGFYPQFTSLLEIDIPTIAAINGAAVGAGMCLALMCDLRIAAEDAAMSVPFAKIGIHPGMLATALLARTVSHTHAAELLYTGRVIRGAEAATIGLVNRSVPSDQVMDAAVELANEIAANAPLALRYTKQGLRLAFKQAEDQAAAWEGFAQPVTMATEDVKEGLDAVRNKRKPLFRGR